MLKKTAVLLFAAALAACGKSAEEGAPAELGVTPAAESETPPELTLPPPPATPDAVAVNEPLPPMEGATGIRLTRQARMETGESEAPFEADLFYYQGADGSVLVRLENVRAAPAVKGDLFVSRELAPVTPQQGQNVLLRLGALKGPTGSMNYLIEKGTDLSDARSIALIEPNTWRVLAYTTLQTP